MSFDFQITADPKQALDASTKVEKSLSDIEQRAHATGKAVETGMGGPALKDAQGRFLATGVAAKQLEAASHDLAGATRLEEAAMSSAHRALSTVDADLGKMAGDHVKAAAATDLHEKALKKLHDEASKEGRRGHEGGFEIEGSFGQAIAGRFGEAGELVHGLSKGTLAAGAAVGVGAEIVNLNDEYIQLENSARRLGAGEKSLDDVLGEQYKLAGDLHTTMEKSIELTLAVKERTDELGFSMEHQVALARELGEVGLLSGRSAEESAAAFEKFAFALESGMPAGRALKTIMLEFPPLAEALKEKFHATSEQLIDMANKHKISTETLYATLDESTAKFAVKSSQVAETAASKWDHFKDGMIIVGHATAQAMESFGGLHFIDEFAEALRRADAGLIATNDILAVLDDKLKKITNSSINANRQVLELGDVFDFLGKAGTAVVQLGEKYGSWADTVVTASKKLSSLDEMFNHINEPMKRHQQELRDIETLYARGRITAEQWAVALEEVHAHDPAKAQYEREKKAFDEERKLFEQRNEFLRYGIATPQAGNYTDEVRAQDELTEAKRREQFVTQAQNAQREHEKQLLAGLEKPLVAGAKEFRDLAEAKDRDLLKSGEYEEKLAMLRDRYDDVKTPAEEVRKQLELIDLRLKENIYDAEHAAMAVDLLHEKFDKSFGQGLKNGLKSIKEEMMDVAGPTKKLLEDAFHGIEDAIVSAVTQGKFSWQDFARTVEADLARLAIRQLESSLLSAISPTAGAIGGALAGHAMGGSWTVPGSGTGDSTLQAFWATPGETVTVTPAGGSSARQSGPAPHVTNKIVVQHDPRQLVDAVDTDAGGRAMTARIRANPNAIRSALR